VTLVGAQLLGLRMSAALDGAAPAHWWDQRKADSLWSDIALGPTGRGSFADDGRSRARRGTEPKFIESKDQCVAATVRVTGVTVAQEDGDMQKVGNIGKFLQLGSVVQGGQRNPRWFSLPGSWRMPRIQIMRRRDQSNTVERDERRTVRMLATAEEHGGW